MDLIRYIQDQILAALQRRCDHPGHMVAADILKGCADGIQIKYCRRCGSLGVMWRPKRDLADRENTVKEHP